MVIPIRISISDMNHLWKYQARSRISEKSVTFTATGNFSERWPFIQLAHALCCTELGASGNIDMIELHSCPQEHYSRRKVTWMGVHMGWII